MRSALLIVSTMVPLMVLAANSGAQAFPAKCLLQVDGKNYLNGQCNVDADSDGSFSIGTGESQGPNAGSPYFAYVNVVPGNSDNAEAWWNETPRSTHANSSLGTVKRSNDNACWINARAKICWSKF